MTFLAPIAGLVAAAAALPLLLALYFLRLRRRPVRVSSVMLWEQAARDVQANVPLQWLRPSWLLLLQALAMALLAVAFARPAIDDDDTPAARIILVIDASASMSAPADPAAGLPQGATRLDQAKAAATEILARTRRSGRADTPSGADQPATSAAVIVFAASARTVSGFTGDRGRLKRAIESIEPTDQPASLDAALRLVEAQTAPTGEDAGIAPTRVVLLSDAGFPPGQRTEAGVGDAELVFIRVGPAPDAPRDNVAIVALSARRDFDDPALVRVFARITSTATSSVEAPLTLRLRGQPVRSQVVTIPAATPDGPGETPLTLEARDTEGGVLALSIERADALSADNDAAAVLAPAAPARVLLVAPGDAAPAPDAFLLRALEEAVGAAVTVVALAEHRRRANEPGWLASFDLLVADRVALDAPPPIPTLSFASTAGAPAMRLVDDPPGESRFASWRRSHPLMRHVSLDQVVLSGAPTIAFDAPQPGAPRVTPLALGRNGPLIALLDGGPVQRVAVAFALEQSTWPLQISFAVFIANSVTHLATNAARAEAVLYTTATPITVRAQPGAERIRVTGPAERTAPVRAGDTGVGLGALPRVGLYNVEPAHPADAALAVNLLDANESAIATRDAIDIGAGVAQAEGVSAAAAREVWHWFVLAALALLTLEWLLYARSMRV